jgi:FkbM family methyltransferase
VNVFHEFPALIERLGIEPRHLVHVGAHEAQEWPWYQQAQVQRVTWVEPIPELAAKLRDRFAATPGVRVVECACSDEPGHARLSVTNPSNTSTLLTPGPRDRVVTTIDVIVRRLVDIAPDATIAVIDAQGVELEVLKGAPWETLDLIIVEACTVHDPTIAAGYDDVIALATARGWREWGCWSRDYGLIDRFARGRPVEPPPPGEVRDVILVR